MGVDSYSYHRLLGEIRPGEDDPGVRFNRGSLDVVAECRRLGVAGVSLETCFLDPPERLDCAALVHEADGMEMTLAWGHPHGLEFGARREALDELLAWIRIAPRLGVALVRLVAASPRFRGEDHVDRQIARTVPALRTACDAARDGGVSLAIENHADLTGTEMAELLGEVGDDILGVCLDTANALRVGDDVLETATLLAPWVRQVHLKDVEGTWSDPVAGPRSVPYGEGMIPLEGVLDVLDAASFAGLVCVELGHLGPGVVDERNLVGQSVGWLKARVRR